MNIIWIKPRKSTEYEVIRSEGAGLVEARDVDAAAERDAERLGAEDAEEGEGAEGGVDGDAEDEGQLRGHDGGEDEARLEEQLVRAAPREQPLAQQVGHRQRREAQQHQDEAAALGAVRGDGLRAEEDGAQQPPLVRLEPGAQHARQHALPGRRVLLPGVHQRQGEGLQQRGARGDHVRVAVALQAEPI